MAHHVHLPAAALAKYVRYYVTMDDRLATRTVIQPIPARSTPLIDFQFGHRCELMVRDQRHREFAHVVAVVGSQSFGRVQIVGHGHVQGFAIIFQPGALFRLFSLPLNLLTNQHYEGRAVIGPGIDELARRLGESKSSEERVRHADAYLLSQCPAESSRTDISAVASHQLLHRGCLKISDLAVRSGLSARQIERRFLEQVGLPPKTFSRVVRFEAALKARRQSPQLRWADVAQDLGYHDQMHMVHDFREFSDATPSSAANQLHTLVTDEIEGTRDSR